MRKIILILAMSETGAFANRACSPLKSVCDLGYSAWGCVYDKCMGNALAERKHDFFH